MWVINWSCFGTVFCVKIEEQLHQKPVANCQWTICGLLNYWSFVRRLLVIFSVDCWPFCQHTVYWQSASLSADSLPTVSLTDVWGGCSSLPSLELWSMQVGSNCDIHVTFFSLQVKSNDDDFGWGVVLNFQKKANQKVNLALHLHFFDPHLPCCLPSLLS